MSGLSRILRTEAGWMGYRLSGKGVDRIILPHESREELLGKYGLSGGPGSGLKIMEDSLIEYFRGGTPDFKGVPIDLSGVTEFRERIYLAAREIPYGHTRTYSELARSVGSPRAARAVGYALKRNPIPIIIPCHRIVGSHGLGGFTPSIDLKKKLLRLEGSL